MLEELATLERQGLEELRHVGDSMDPARALESLESWRLRFVGKQGLLTSLLRGLGKLPVGERPVAGQAANQVKGRLEAALSQRQRDLSTLAMEQALVADTVDITLPGREPVLGHQHPLTLALDDMLKAFSTLGFRAVEGPEVEWDYYNFEALNIPADHPARDMWDTFWITDEMLLRTHTSPMQVRTLETTPPPLRVVIPGRCHRYEAVDATHESTFFQLEGLMVDEQCTLADLKGTLTEFVRQLFGNERRTRFRCDYFPFVEPGAEMSMDCFACGGSGCRLCKQTGWIEILGAGMVHPGVLRRVGLDAERYRGFAFGMGIDRVAMLKYNLNDLRHFYQNDVRLLRQFTFPVPAAETWSGRKPA